MGSVVVEGTVAEVLYHGAMKRIELDDRRRAAGRGGCLGGEPRRSSEGDRVRLAFPRDALHVDGAAHDAAAPSTFPRRASALLRRISDVLLARRGFYLLLLLVPPLLWLGVVYLGSLFALLAESFFSIDDFSGVVVREPTLEDLRRAAPAGELRRHRAHRQRRRRSVTLLAIVVAFPIAYYAARYARGRWKARVLSRGDDAAVVELSRQGLRVEAAARQGRRRSAG